MTALADGWEIAWGAGKGERRVVLPYAPKPLDQILTEIPAGHSEANIDRKSGVKPIVSKVRLLGNHRGKKVIEVMMETSDTYYKRYYLILAEVAESAFQPVFVYQFSPGHIKIAPPQVKATEEVMELSIEVTVTGSDPTSDTYRVSLDKKLRPTTTETNP